MPASSADGPDARLPAPEAAGNGGQVLSGMTIKRNTRSRGERVLGGRIIR